MTTIEFDHAAAPTTAVARAPLVALFRSLAEPNRLAILHLLSQQERRVRDLTLALGLAQSTVSAHCQCLVDCGLIVGRSHGRATYYALARPELLDLLEAAQALLAATGDAVAECRTYGLRRPS